VEQLDSYFRSWHTYVESRGGKLPYDEQDIQAIAYHYLEDEAPSGIWREACPGLWMMWGRSGHLVGAVWFRLEMEGKRLFFSGDFSRESELLAADAPGLDNWEWADGMPVSSPDLGIADISIIDNAYGMDMEPQPVKLEQLRTGMEQVLSSGGHVLLPVPAFGRGQELIVWAGEQFPGQAMIVEPDIWQGLQRLRRWREWLRPEAPARIERVLYSGRIFVPRDTAERVRLLERNASAIILTGDGMMDSPRARWYYQYLSDGPGTGSGEGNDNGIILTGHASSGSFGKSLLESADQSDTCTVRHMIYKVHQGLPDVRRMLEELPSAQIVLVHAPKPQTDLVRDELIREGWTGHEGSVRAIHSLEPGVTLIV
jgi:Cft2 family RNA processing exonuclease